MKNTKKWYERKSFLIPLFIICPPIWIYLIIKGDSKFGKKIVYSILALLWSFFLFSGTITGSLFILLDTLFIIVYNLIASLFYVTSGFSKRYPVIVIIILVIFIIAIYFIRKRKHTNN